MKRRPILVCSSSFDEHTHGPVCVRLEAAGWDVVTFHVDRVLNGSESFSIAGIGESQPVVTYQGYSIAPDEIAAAWLWKVNNFAIPDAEENLSKQLTMVNEITQFNGSVWSLYPEDAWLSSPVSLALAEKKLVQLQVANRLGFTVPKTQISNSWDEVAEFKDAVGGDLVVKMFRGVIADQNKVKAMYTTILNDARIDSLRRYTVAFPGIFQSYVAKSREWRVTVVGDEVFPAAIYASDEAKDDWRRLQQTAAVAFRRDPFPESVAELCRTYLKHFNLGIGSFDLVEDPSGRFTFLECNPNGQFGFLEELLDLPVSAAVASEIAAIARRCST